MSFHFIEPTRETTDTLPKVLILLQNWKHFLSGAGSAASYLVAQAEPDLPGSVNLGALGPGVLNQTVTGGRSSPSAYPVPTSEVLFGSASNTATSSPNFKFTDSHIVLANGGATLSPASAGAFRYNSATNKLQFSNNGGAWADIGGAPSNATYITQTPDSTLTNEQALSLLATGILKSTTGTGVVSIAGAGTDYEVPLTFTQGVTRTVNTVRNDLITGINGNQTITGGTATGQTLTYRANSLLDGKHIFASTTGMVYNESTGVLSLGIASTSTATSAQFKRSDASGNNVYIQNPSTASTAYMGITLGTSDVIFAAGAYFGFWLYGTNFATSGNRTPGTSEFQNFGGTGNMLFNLTQASGDFVWTTGVGLTERIRMTNGGVFTVGGTVGLQYTISTNVLSTGIITPASNTAAHFKFNSGTGNNVYIQNPSSGTGAYMGVTIGNNDTIFTGPYLGFWQVGASYTTFGFATASSAWFQLGGGSGNMWFDLHQASGDYIFSTTTSNTERMRIANSGTITMGPVATAHFKYQHSAGPNTGAIVTLGQTPSFGNGAALIINAEDTYYDDGLVKAALWVTDSYPQYSAAVVKSGVYTSGLVGYYPGTGFSDLPIYAGGSHVLRLGYGGTAVPITGTDSITIDGGSTPAGLISILKDTVFNQTQTVASSASAVLDATLWSSATTITVSGGIHITTATGFNLAVFDKPTYVGSSSVTIDNAATVVIKGAPVAGSLMTITNPYALWIQAGDSRVCTIVPDADTTYNLGSSSRQWSEVWTATVSGNGGSHILTLRNQSSAPATSLALTGSQIDVTGSLIPTVDATYNLGSAAKQWVEVWTATVSGNGGSHILTLRNESASPATSLVLTGAQIDVTGKMIPTADNTYDLGSGTKGWHDFYAAANMRAANGSVATALTSVGPTGSHTTVQEWLVVKTTAGNTRYIAMF